MQAVAHFIDTFVPEHYDLFLDLNRADKTFSGKVTITGEAKAEKISLHQKDLTIEAVEVAGQARPFTLDNNNEALYIELAAAGPVEVTLTYTGKITDNMTGIYPSYYTVDGVKKEIISTQFESHFAREAFPSVDEPEAKATFDLANLPCLICLKSTLKTVKRQAFGSLKEPLACLPISWPLLQAICKALLLKLKTVL